ncbi:thiamine phosphate synthase [Sphingomonas sp.]|jgi:thiamine-phosphate pyrophosphorylase|uniref:thiamine phosphate synthase n=1 Tax=Sphingomonas sp. TaxID=28214 RepID=UPI0035C7BEB8
MTDERADLWAAVRRLPPGAGVVFRHYATEPAERRRLFARLRRTTRAKRLVLVRAGAIPLPGEMGIHGRPGRGLVTWPAHDRVEALAGRLAGAALLFVSPVYPTRSHPGAPALGPAQAARLGRGLGVGLIALGGMDARRFRPLSRFCFAGWAAIDAWNS